MNIKPNIGVLNRYLRLTAGLVIYGSGITQRRNSLTKYALMSLGSMKMAEGIVGWCPLLALAGVSTLEDGNSQKKTGQSNQKKASQSQHEQGARSGDTQDSKSQSDNQPQESESHHGGKAAKSPRQASAASEDDLKLEEHSATSSSKHPSEDEDTDLVFD